MEKFELSESQLFTSTTNSSKFESNKITVLKERWQNSTEKTVTLLGLANYFLQENKGYNIVFYDSNKSNIINTIQKFDDCYGKKYKIDKNDIDEEESCIISKFKSENGSIVFINDHQYTRGNDNLQIFLCDNCDIIPDSFEAYQYFNTKDKLIYILFSTDKYKKENINIK